VDSAVDVVTEVYRRFRDGDDPFPLLDDDIEWAVETPDARAGVSHGHRGVAEFFRTWLGTWDDYRIDLEETHDAPDGRVVAFFREQATGRGSRVPVEMRPGAVIEVRGGKIVRYHGFVDRDEALRAAGLQRA
jgi:ketosteroid isomerase-like protein